MFIKHEEGKTELVYEVKVNIPPVGLVYDYTEKGWVKSPVFKDTSTENDQKWFRHMPGFDYEDEREREKDKQKYDKLYFDPKLEGYRNDEWFKRLSGIWFMCKGVPTYITGLHYMYLNWWKIDIGYPHYRDSDRRTWLYWQWCVENPDSYGLIECTRRRSGKTARAALAAFDPPSRMYNVQSGIQSKTRDDAKSFFIKLMGSFKYLPDFFQPVYDYKKIQSTLGFRFPAASQKLNKSAVELNSDVTFKSSDNLAYDSQKLIRYVRDEFAKINVKDPKMNIVEGWSIVKPTMSLGSKSIIGKAYFTSTVEEGGSEPAQELWMGSGWEERGKELNRTKSGLCRLFTPAYDNDEDFIDSYGACDKFKAKSYQQQIRDSLSGNPRQLASYIRKFPWTIEEAFYRDADLCPFNVLKLNEQLSTMSFLSEPMYIKGNFVWEDDVQDTLVNFVESSNGRFLLHKDVDLNEDWNFVEGDEKKRPLNSNVVIGVDPFDHKAVDIVDQKRMSMGGCYGFHKFDGLDNELSETFLFEYLARPDDPDDFYEDCLMASYFFGGRLLVENNKSGFLNYFDRRGYSSWLIRPKGRRKTQRGIAAGVASKEQLASGFASYIDKNTHKIVFPRLLNDLLDFDIQNSTKNDATMSAGWAIVAAYRLKRNRKVMQDEEDKSAGEDYDFDFSSISII